MNFKTRVIILSAILFLLVTVLILRTVFSPQREMRRSLSRPLVTGIEPANVTDLTITGPDGEVSLEQPESGEWFLILESRRYPADPDKVNNLLEALKNSRRGSVVSRNPEDLGVFELGDAAEKLTVSGLPSGPDHEIYFGKKGAGRNEYYVRLKGGDAVYLADTSAGFYVEQGPEYYSDLLMAPAELNPQDIQRIQTSGYTLLKTEDEGGWMFAQGEDRVDPDKAGQLAAALASLRASSYAVPSAEGAFPSGGGSEITFVTGAGKAVTFTVFGKTGEEQYLAQSSVKTDGQGNPYRFFLSEYTYNRIMKSRENLSADTAERDD
ncbi:MAG: DUF4340 domain-containing protein [Spirochaetia bacterium]